MPDIDSPQPPISARLATVGSRAGAAFAVVLVTAPAAFAQNAETPQFDQYLTPNIPGTATEPGVSVLSRNRPDYDSIGIHAGAFTIRPELTESAGYDSNVLGTAKPKGSAAIETNGKLEATSNWEQDSVRAAVTVDDLRYTALPQQSFTNWTASLSGSHQFDRDVISASYTHLNLNEVDTGLDTVQLARPLSYTVDSAQLGYRVNINRVFITPSMEVATYAYGNSAVFGTPYQENYRNRVVWAPGITAGYELAPQHNLIVVLRDANASYSNRVAGLASRNFNDVSALGGIDYSASAEVRYRVLAGYQVRSFSSRAYRTIQSPIVEGSLIWTPTGLTTVTGTASRHIQDSADETTAGYTESLLQIRVDHEYLHDVLLRANAGVYFSQYGQGGGNQTLYTAGVGATYLLNTNMRLTVSYDFSARQSNGQGNLGFGAAAITPGSANALGQANGFGFGSNYTDHLLMLRVTFRL